MGCCRCCCLLILTVAVIIGVMLGLFAGFFPYPSHASCTVDWQFGKSCSLVKGALTRQIEEWSGNPCSPKQQCGYELLDSSSSDVIKGRRTVPVFMFTDTFNFTLSSDRNNGCKVKGISSSDAWYAVIDFGFNYCNMRNLVIGSKLDESDPAYEETSTNAQCTMYSIAHCNMYTE